MKRTPYLLWSALLFLLLFGSGCNAATPEAAVPTAAAEATATRAPIVIMTPTPAPAADNLCLDCHTDKERLIQTARAEPVVESESKGEG